MRSAVSVALRRFLSKSIRQISGADSLTHSTRESSCSVRYLSNSPCKEISPGDSMKCLSCSIDSESRQMLIRESASFESGLARGAERSVSRASMIMVTCSLRVPVFFRDPYGPAVSDQKVELSEKAWPAAGRLELWLRSAPGL